jgi:uncharacterized membrane protein
MPGIGELIEGAVQQAAQPGRQSMPGMLSPASGDPMAGGGVGAHNRKQESFLMECLMAKSASFGVLHLGVAFSLSFALTGNVAIAGAITLVEPAANTVVHCFFDRWWQRRHPAPAPAAA